MRDVLGLRHGMELRTVAGAVAGRIAGLRPAAVDPAERGPVRPDEAAAGPDRELPAQGAGHGGRPVGVVAVVGRGGQLDQRPPDGEELVGGQFGTGESDRLVRQPDVVALPVGGDPPLVVVPGERLVRHGEIVVGTRRDGGRQQVGPFTGEPGETGERVGDHPGLRRQDHPRGPARVAARPYPACVGRTGRRRLGTRRPGEQVHGHRRGGAVLRVGHPVGAARVGGIEAEVGQHDRRPVAARGDREREPAVRDRCDLDGRLHPVRWEVVHVQGWRAGHVRDHGGGHGELAGGTPHRQALATVVPHAPQVVPSRDDRVRHACQATKVAGVAGGLRHEQVRLHPPGEPPAERAGVVVRHDRVS
ncbi:hypothetical protein [Micromonospora sp. CB01531]|uniref:hypothetical protein n=1 Tax=Micromonospora sp. CB01531 TaxID=1718947 RepID=UPI00093E7146|nr:hypothetical protein [Micromonospora sp. CB01531]